MDEREELKQELEQELQWIKYRQKMLDIMEEKLLQMREIANRVKEENLITAEIEALNINLNNLAVQVKAIDSESRRIEEGKILEWWASVATEIAIDAYFVARRFRFCIVYF